ncbi:MAG: PAS domain-containing protein, partial [Mariprofundaceae bacterium]
MKEQPTGGALSRTDQFPLLDHIGSGILAIDRDATIVLWNKNMEQWCGQSREQVLGQKLFELFPNTNADVFKIRIEQVLTGGAPVIFSAQLHHHMIPCLLPNGEYRTQLVTVTWLEDHQIALFSIMDQTEHVRLIEQYKTSARSLKAELDQRLKLENKNMQLATAIDQAGEAVVITDVDGRIEYANQSFVDQTGWPIDEIHSIDYFDVLIDKSDDNFSDQLKLSVKAEESWVGRQQLIRKSGSSFIASISIAPI